MQEAEGTLQDEDRISDKGRIFGIVFANPNRYGHSVLGPPLVFLFTVFVLIHGGSETLYGRPTIKNINCIGPNLHLRFRKVFLEHPANEVSRHTAKLTLIPNLLRNPPFIFREPQDERRND